MTGSLSSCCQISERENETASGKDRKRSVKIETVEEWTLSPPYITFFFSNLLCSLKPPWGESKILPSPQSPTQWVRGQPAGFQNFSLLFLSPSPIRCCCLKSCHCLNFPIEVATAMQSCMVWCATDAFIVNSQIGSHMKNLQNVLIYSYC